MILAARKLERLEKTAAEILQSGGRASYYELNIRNETMVQDTIEQILREHETLDGLVNNAGGQFPSPAEDISQKGWHAVIETNLTGTFNMTRAAFNQAMSKRGGAIVNIVAEMWRGFPGMSHTGAARAGVVNLTQTLAVEWASRGVRINAVAPGYIYGHGITQYDPAFIEQVLATINDDIPAKRMGTESEVAAAVTFLLSPAAVYITGETIRVDGGSSLWRKPWDIPEHNNLPAYNGFGENVEES